MLIIYTEKSWKNSHCHYVNLICSTREWTDDNAQEILRRILNTPDDDSVGYIVEVDLSYPDSLHDLHSDYTLAPIKEPIDECWLSEYQSNLLTDMQIKKPPHLKRSSRRFSINKNIHCTTKLWNSMLN